MKMKVIGIIPARGGSKSVPHKNIRPLGGVPLIAHTIRAAQASRGLARTIVSTDSAEIARVCREHGAEVPFIRPASLAQDDTATLPVLLHALEQLAESYDAVMVLQPTSPLRTPEDIDRSIELLAATPEADAVISVVKVGDHHPARMKTIENGWLANPPFAELAEGMPRQALPAFYLRNGAIYLTRVSILRGRQSLQGRHCLPYIMPEERSVNIDAETDFLLAEVLLARNKKQDVADEVRKQL